jgi:hypothetical protein
MSLSHRPSWPACVALVLGLVLVGGCSSSTSSTSSSSASSSPAPAAAVDLPAVHHVFVVNLENKSYADTFGADSKAPYLSKTLTSQGVLLKQFFGIAHHSLPNYLAQISGQAPNPDTQDDCTTFTEFEQTGVEAPQQAVGRGCVYPSSVTTIADQLETRGLSWRGYLEDMGTPCRHPDIGSHDATNKARDGDQYATKHNPFVYFHSIVDSPSCRRDVVDLSHLQDDLAAKSTTRNLSYITPNLCNDGHDSPCVDGRPGGLTSADAWLRTWVPRITASPAFRADGMLVVTFDEAENGNPGAADACCGQVSGPNTDQAGLDGPGGGRIGAVVLSPFVEPGSSSDQPYNQYSLERTLARIFGVAPLGYGRHAREFGADVWSRSAS